MSTKDLLTYEVDEGVGLLTLNRPDKLNALNSDVLAELESFFSNVKEQKNFDVKGIIFTGAGEKAFIAGADIAEMQKMSKEESYKFGWIGQKVTHLIEDLHVPVIACVNGFALGGGCEMAMACDFIYATENAVFGQPEVKLGLIPGFGGTQRLAKYVGRAHAKEIIYSGRNIKIEEAVELGLVLRSFLSKDDMIETAKQYITNLGKNSPMAIMLAKKAIQKGVDLTNAEGLEIELDLFSEAFVTEDMKEGTQAFVEKRKPDFKGC